MKITVAIPCYNLEERIATCLESVILQDYMDVEILVIDDYSTDHSVEIVNDLIRKHPEREIRFIVNETNLGISKVRNLAIDEACGELLFFVDGDDTIEPGTLSLFHQRMVETNVEVVCGSFRVKDSKGNTFVVKQYQKDTIKDGFAYASQIEKNGWRLFRVAVWNNLYRLDFLRSHKIYCDIHYRIYEDSLFTFRVVQNVQSISFIHDVTYNYWQYGNSIIHQKKDVEFIRTYQLIVESAFESINVFSQSKKIDPIPRGIRFVLNRICLTGGLLKYAIESDVSKNEKKKVLIWLRETYRRNDMSLNNIVGPYNKISFLSLLSPFPYILFCFYFKHLKTVAKIVNYWMGILEEKKENEKCMI